MEPPPSTLRSWAAWAPGACCAGSAAAGRRRSTRCCTPGTGQRAALKLLRDPDHPDRDARREYRALALLDHPGIVRVYSCGRLPGGPPWLLMELVVGVSSQASVQAAGPRGSQARASRALHIARDLLEALAYLHRRRIIHRDVKSSNVLATVEGGIKLLDLGAAAYAPAGGGWGPVRVPGSGAFAGTVVYASPEQLCGADLDARTDLFSVGVLWYRMLTGELPFPATEPGAALAARAAGAPMERLRGVTGVAPEIAELVGALLEPEPQHRPGGAGAVLERIRPLVVPEPGRAIALWPEPPPLCGRCAELEVLDGFVAAAPAGSLAVLESCAGQDDGALLGWIVATTRRGGGVAVGVDLADGQAGGLLPRLLLALPRHLRRGGGGTGAPREATVGALDRLAHGRATPIVLTIDGLERAGESDIADLSAVLATGAARGRAIRAVGLWRVDGVGAAQLGPACALHLRLPPLAGAPMVRHARTLSAQRVLPYSIEAALLHPGRAPAGGVGAWTREQVAARRLALSATPEGLPVWVEGIAGAEEGPGCGGLRLGLHLAGEPVAVPWAGLAGEAWEPFAGMLAVEPEEEPEPSARAVLFAWRGLARQLAGDRDLQAEADLLRAEEELRRPATVGWAQAPRWGRRIALARAAGMLAREGASDAQRWLGDPGSASPDPGWPLDAVALRVARGRAAGEALRGNPGPEAAAEYTLACLQEGRLREVSWVVRNAAEPPPGAWGAADRAALAVAEAGAARLQGALATARGLLLQAIEAAEVGVPGPPRARLLMALAELDLDLFQPGPCRERLADAWVLLRQCHRPELAAERARLLARVALLRGEPGRAEEAARRGLDLLRGTDFVLARATLGCWLARALGRQGRRAEAEALLASAQPRIEAARAQPPQARARLARWELVGPREDPEAFFAPVGTWTRRERARLWRFEWLLAALRHAEAVGDSTRHASLRRRARSLLRTLQRDLAPQDRATMEQSPALRVVLGVR
ncbi:MAG: serine/threonine-protein kinase [Pseudomonadota bacterium]